MAEKKTVQISDTMELKLNILTKEQIAEGNYMTASALETELKMRHGTIKESVAKKKVKPVGVNNRGNLYYKKEDIETFAAERKAEKTDNRGRSVKSASKKEEKKVETVVKEEKTAEPVKENAESTKTVTEQKVDNSSAVNKKVSADKDVKLLVYCSYALLTVYLLFKGLFGISTLLLNTSLIIHSMNFLLYLTYITSVVLMIIARVQNPKDKGAKICMWVHITILVLLSIIGVFKALYHATFRFIRFSTFR